MSIKSIFENYYENKMSVTLITREIKMVERDILPSHTSHLSLTPKTHSNQSSTEYAALNLIENEEINRLKEERSQLLTDIEAVDQLYELLQGDQKKVIELRLKEKLSWGEIAESMFVDPSTALRKYNKVFQQFEKLRGN